MRFALLFLTGLVLLVTGVAVLAAAAPKWFLVGLLLVIAGLACKACSFLVDDSPRG